MWHMEADANEGGSDVRSLVHPVVSPAGSMGGGVFYTRWEVDPRVVTCWSRSFYLFLYSFLIPGFYCSIRLSVTSSWGVKNQNFIKGMTFDL